MIDNKADHVFHVWINQEATRFRRLEEADKKPEKHDIDPHGRGLYAFKSAMNLIESKGQSWLGATIGKNRRKSLPLTHQQCSHSAPEPLKENYHQCYLGERLDSCPILIRLRATFDEERQRSEYYRAITDEQVDEVAARVCVWHLLMGLGPNAFVDWNEGAFQSVSDRMFWDRVYSNMAHEDEHEPVGSQEDS